MIAINPFVSLPQNICGDAGLPVVSDSQDCTSYEQQESEIKGLIILPLTSNIPGDTSSLAGFSAFIDNTGSSSNSGRYIVGSGSYLPGDQQPVILAGGRVEENRERTETLTFTVFNMHSGHVTFGKRLQSNSRSFYVWLETVEGRIIGGEGMRPYFVNATFPFGQGKNVKEQMVVEMRFGVLNTPTL